MDYTLPNVRQGKYITLHMMMDHLVFLEPDRNLQQAIEAFYIPELVWLSLIIPIFSSYVAFLVSMRIRGTRLPKGNAVWLFAGALVLGFGIWSMHFVGMLAYKLPFAVNYDILTTLISVVPAILSGLVILLTTRESIPSKQNLLLRATLTGSGIGMMHYIGMSAMRMEGIMRYDLFLFILSIVIAVVFSFISLQLKLWADEDIYKVKIISSKLLITSIVTGFAISSMHYSGMAAMYVFEDNSMLIESMIWQPEELAIIIGVIAILTGLILVIAVEINTRLILNQQILQTKEKQEIILNTIADAIISIDPKGVIKSFSPSAEKIFGYQPDEIISQDIDVLFNSRGSSKNDSDDTQEIQIFLNQTTHPHELKGRHKDGTSFFMEVAFTPITQGTENGYVATMRDISARKKSEQLFERNYQIQSLIFSLLNTSLKEQTLNSFLQYAIDKITKSSVISVENKGAIFLVGSTGNSLKMVAQNNLHPYLQEKCRALAFGTCFCGKAAQQKTIQYSDCVDHNHEITFDGMGPHGHYCIPLISKHKLLGVLNLYLEQGHKPHSNEIELLDVIANTLAGIIERMQAEHQLSYQASHDALTGLINRREFEHRAERLIRSSRDENIEHALCFMDLDQFKVINDTCGHIAGDELLRQVGILLKQTVSKRDTLARLGGDEFAILMEDCSLDQAKRVTDSVLQNIKEFHFLWEEQTFRIGVSIGLVELSQNSLDFNELLKRADAACYMAKDLGRNRIQVYNQDDTDLAQRQGEMQWVTKINQALEEDRLALFAQPIISLDNSSDMHYELLLRMKTEDGEFIPPGAFLPAAERYNLVEIIDSWVIKKVFRLLSENTHFVQQVKLISINLSGPSLTNSGILEFISAQLKQSAVDPSKICFEITETIAISNLSTASIFISTLKEMGCHFALDDFGSGLSSFGYLKNLPVDYLKIDGMFVKDITKDPIDFAMVKSINEIGQVMGMQTIAEFVENDEIWEKLKSIGVDYGQGYGIGKPVPFIDLLQQTRPTVKKVKA